MVAYYIYCIIFFGYGKAQFSKWKALKGCLSLHDKQKLFVDGYKFVGNINTIEGMRDYFKGEPKYVGQKIA